MQNKKVTTRELLTRNQLKGFTPAPMRFFTRNTEHKLTTTNLFDLSEFLNFIAVDNYLPVAITPTNIISQGDALGTALAILIHQVKNN
jgi:predicted membrane GTPase involved in stress response